jgi:hypothetical protein
MLGSGNRKVECVQPPRSKVVERDATGGSCMEPWTGQHTNEGVSASIYLLLVEGLDTERAMINFSTKTRGKHIHKPAQSSRIAECVPIEMFYIGSKNIENSKCRTSYT